MPIHVACPRETCRKSLALDEAATHAPVRCPQCGQVFRLGRPPAAASAPAETLMLAAETAPNPPAPTLTDVRLAPAPSAGSPAVTAILPAVAPTGPAQTMMLPATGAAAPAGTLVLPAAPTAEPISDPTMPAHVGRYVIRQRLGEGAFGVVYRAHDPQVDREVALKVAKPQALSSEERVKRFLQEAKAAGNLRHPNIVPVHDSGRDGDQYFIASAFIAGRTLDAELEQRGPDGDADPRRALEPRAAARLVQRLAEALAYAHKKGVIHRDIKPANVLVDEQGEPMLVDFGLAAQPEGEEKLTQEATALGTPAYMAPEQAKGKAIAASDQYSLGCTLYELLTGRTPFHGPPAIQLVLHQTQEAPAPRTLQRSLPRDVETICLKALAKQPAERYPSCREMADDLRRFIDDEPIAARRLTLVERTWRFCKREPLVAGAVAVAVLALLTVAGVMTFSAERQRQLNEVANREKEKAELAAEQEQAARVRAEGAETKAVAAAVQEKAEAEKARQVSQFLVRLFETSDPIGLSGFAFRKAEEAGGELKASEVLQRAEKLKVELKEQQAVRAALLDTIGNVYRSMGLHQRAKPLLEEALQLRQATGREDRELASSLHNLAWLRYEQGDFFAAEPLFRKALAIRRRELGEDHPQTVETKFILAWALTLLTDLEDAERLFQDVLAIRRKQYGDEHREVAVAQIGLAALYMDTGRELEATPLSLQAAQSLLKVEGAQGLARAASKAQQAVLMHALHNYSAADAALKDAYEVSQKHLGQQHYALAFILYYQAVLQKEQGQAEKALEYLQACVKMVRQTPGLQHMRSLAPVQELANMLKAQNRLPEAEALLGELIKVREEQLGKDHPIVADGLLALARLLQPEAPAQDRDRTARCEQLLRRAVAIYEPVVAAKPRLSHFGWEASRAFHDLGFLYHQCGRQAEAEQALRQSQAILKRLSEIYPKLAHFRSGLSETHWVQSRVYLAMNRKDLAEKELLDELVLNKVLAVEKGGPELKYDVMVTHSCLGNIYRDGNRTDKALEAFREASAVGGPLARSYPGAANYQVEAAYAAANLGRLLHGAHRLDEAEKAYQDEAAARKRLAESQPRNVGFVVELAQVYQNLTAVAREAKKDEPALDYQNQLVQMLQTASKDAQLAVSLRQLLVNAYLSRADLQERFGQAGAALRDLNEAAAQLPDQPVLLGRHALLRARQGDHAAAVREADQLVPNPERPDVLQQRTQIYARAAVAVRRDAQVPEDEQARLADEYLKKALSALTPLDVKWKHFRRADALLWLKTEPDLAALRERDDFKNFLAAVEPKSPTTAR